MFGICVIFSQNVLSPFQGGFEGEPKGNPPFEGFPRWPDWILHVLQDVFYSSGDPRGLSVSDSDHAQTWPSFNHAMVQTPMGHFQELAQSNMCGHPLARFFF